MRDLRRAVAEYVLAIAMWLSIPLCIVIFQPQDDTPPADEVVHQEDVSQDEITALQEELIAENDEPVADTGNEVSPPITARLTIPEHQIIRPSPPPMQMELPRLETSRLEITPPPAPAYQPPPTIYVPSSAPPLPSVRQSPYSASSPQSAYIPSIPTSLVYVGGSTGHWIESVSDDGRIIVLEDQSVWEVHPFDQVISALWLPVSDIVVVESNDPIYSYRLINKDDRETVLARLIAQ